MTSHSIFPGQWPQWLWVSLLVQSLNTWADEAGEGFRDGGWEGCVSVSGVQGVARVPCCRGRGGITCVGQQAALAGVFETDFVFKLLGITAVSLPVISLHSPQRTCPY